MAKFTVAQKKAYFTEQQARRRDAKAALTEGRLSEIEAIIANHGMNISSTGFQIVAMEMKRHGFDGLPYLDAKTYKGWKENGFQVKKGEKSVLSSITWIPVNGKGTAGIKPGEVGEDRGYAMPKTYRLFHRSQVEATKI